MPFRMGVPGRMIVPFVTSTQVSTNLASGVYEWGDIYLNSIADPFGTMSGIKPRMHTFWSGLYDNYMVLSTKLVVKLILPEASATGNGVIMQLQTVPYGDVADQPSTIEGLHTDASTKWKVVKAHVSQQTQGWLRQYFSVKRLANVVSLRTQPANSNTFSAGINSDPSYLLKANLTFRDGQFSVSTTTALVFQVTITQYTMLHDRKLELPD